MYFHFTDEKDEADRSQFTPAFKVVSGNAPFILGKGLFSFHARKRGRAVFSVQDGSDEPH